MKVIYGAENCFKCKQLKLSLERNNETFKYVDVSILSREELDKLIVKSGQISLPIVIEE